MHLVLCNVFLDAWLLRLSLGSIGAFYKPVYGIKDYVYIWHKQPYIFLSQYISPIILQ